MWMYQLLNFWNLICIHSVILYTVQKIWFTRKVKFDKTKILGDNSQTKQLYKFLSMCTVDDLVTTFYISIHF